MNEKIDKYAAEYAMQNLAKMLLQLSDREENIIARIEKAVSDEMERLFTENQTLKAEVNKWIGVAESLVEYETPDDWVKALDAYRKAQKDG